MEEVVSILEGIRDYLASIDSKLDNISAEISSLKGIGLGTNGDSLEDICDKLEELKGTGLYNSLSDICDKLDSVETEIGMINL